MRKSGTEFLIEKGDLRQQELCKLLEQEGHIARLVESLESQKYMAGPGTVAVAYVVEEPLRLFLNEKGARVIEYSKCEGCVRQQAAITAENALLTAVLHSKRTIQDSSIMIIGYGRIGKELARLLGAWGCALIICARKPGDLDAVTASGQKAVHIDDMWTALPRCSLIFNTVPALVLDGGRLAFLRPEATLIDLASMPGGVDFEAATNMRINAVRALALPGKLAPISSAMAIKRTVYDELGL